MQPIKLYTPFKVFGYLILVLMAAAIAYAFIIAVRYWGGIGV